jgi:hypothetical protein
MIIENRFGLGKLAIEPPGRAVLQKEITVNEFHKLPFDGSACPFG